jgi:acetolactate synthase-1/2/3 large subunit
MVNIDRTEIEKSSLKIDFVYACDLAQWISDFPIEEIQVNSAWLEWEQKLNKLKILLDIKNETKSIEGDRIDAYTVVEILSRNLRDDSVLVTDMGTSFTCTMQSFQKSQDVRIFTSSGTSSMGFGLPGAIGAYFADPTKRIVLIAGDGGFQMNIQELQTVKYHNIPIAIVILNSEGYLAISIMQKNIFDSNFVGSNPHSGIDAPDFSKVSIAFGISAERVSTSEELESKFNSLSMDTGPFLLEIMLPSDQVMRPRSQSMKDENGKIYSVGLDIMWPYLDQKMKNQVDQIIN